MDEEYPLSDKKLDELFVKNVGSVAGIAEKLPGNDGTLVTCTRWFKILQQATDDEKLARNFMLLLMHQQLNDTNTLSYPFNDERSCQRSLNTLYKISLRQGDIIDVDDDVCESCGSREGSPDCSSSSIEAGGNNDVKSDQKEESAQQLIQLNLELKKELQALQCKKKRLLKRRQQSIVNLQTLHDYSIMYQKEISYMKNIFFCSAITALHMFNGPKPTITEDPQYLKTLFKVLCETKEDKQQIRRLDHKFGDVLRAHIDQKVRDMMCHQMSTEFDALRDTVSKEYKKMIEDKEAVQAQELSVSTMKNLRLLKKLFKDSFNGDVRVKNKVIKFLQKEFNDMDDGKV